MFETVGFSTMATRDGDKHERMVENEQAEEEEGASGDEQASEGERALAECERCGESVLSVYVENGACPQCRGE